MGTALLVGLVLLLPGGALAWGWDNDVIIVGDDFGHHGFDHGFHDLDNVVLVGDDFDHHGFHHGFHDLDNVVLVGDDFDHGFGFHDLDFDRHIDFDHGFDLDFDHGFDLDFDHGLGFHDLDWFD